MDILKQIGLNLRRLRLSRGLSQERLALEADIALNYLSEIERGLRNPTVLVISRLAQVLNVPVVQIFAATSERDSLPQNLRPGPKRRDVTKGRKASR